MIDYPKWLKLLRLMDALAAMPKHTKGGGMTNAQEYALGLLTEEMSEAGAMIGKALRFGIDTPGPPAPPYDGANARQLLEMELGDVMAAIDYAAACKLIDAVAVTRRAGKKLAKLLDPASVDNLGRRLAPDPYVSAPKEQP